MMEWEALDKESRSPSIRNKHILGSDQTLKESDREKENEELSLSDSGRRSRSS